MSRTHLPEILQVIGDRADSLTSDERFCLRKYLALTSNRSALFISTFLRHLPAEFNTNRAMAAIGTLVDKRILAHEPMPIEYRHVGGGSGLRLSDEVLDQL